MYKSKITVDLPSVETHRSMGPIEWLRSLFGTKIDLRSGIEEVTVTAMSLAEGLVDAFKKAGVDDVISFLVDKRVVYMDLNEVEHDLPLLLAAAEGANLLSMPFKEMHVVLSDKSPTLHTLIDCAITNRAVLGEAELTMVLSARLVELQVRKSESAQAYAERVKIFATRTESFDPARHELDALSERLANALSSCLVGAKVRREAALVEMIRPEARQIAKFRELKFGDSVRTPSYRAVPTPRRSGAYVDPFFYYYYDPYYDFTSYLLVESLVHHAAWHSPHVTVVDPAGSPLYTGDNVPADDAWIGTDAITFDSAGDAMVGEAVSRHVADSSWSSHEAPSQHHAELHVAADHDPSSFSESSCNSSSSCSSPSCGSSCSGSSCGSSCSTSND
jgi:hypothetical protein